MFWCLAWGSNPGFTSNKTTYYLLDYGDFTTSLQRKNKRGDSKKKVEELGNKEWATEDLHKPNKRKRGERNHTVDALPLLSLLKSICERPWCQLSTQNSNTQRRTCQAPCILNLNLLRAGQLQRRCSTISNSSHCNIHCNSSTLVLLNLLNSICGSLDVSSQLRIQILIEAPA